jgi:protein-S-isoprenylcysteine O-methyltransferase Ste14
MSLPIAQSSPSARKKPWWPSNRILLSRVFVALALLMVVFIDDRWPAHGFIESSLEMIGLLAVLLCCAGRLWCSLYIGGRKDKELVNQGPYSICRHPLYFFSACGTFGIAATSASLTVIAAVCVVFMLYYPSVMKQEEMKLERLYTEAYRDHCQRVPRFWPRWSLLKEPATHPFSSRLFRRACGDAVWFIIAWVLMMIIHELHGYGVIQPWFVLP